MLVCAAVCPHPPLLVPELASGAADELADLRAACSAAVGEVLAAGPQVLVVVGAGAATREHPPDAAGTLAPYGVPVRVGGRGPEALPLPLAVGAWLLGASEPGVPILWQEVGADTDPEGCAALGSALAGRAERVGMLVMGDASARRTEKAPGWVDERAAPHDAAVAAALRDADAGALIALAPALSTELLAGGRAAWQVLAGAAADGRFSGTLLVDGAPYGVGYLVAVWVAVWREVPALG